MDGTLAGDHVSGERDVVTRDGRAISAHTYLAGTPHAAPLARIFVREHLRRLLPVPVLETVELLTTELVTNVVLHAKTSVRLGVTCDEHNVVVSVEDRNPQSPLDRQRHLVGDELLETGRGMTVIASLADDFGWSRLADGSGKVMSFTLAIPPPVPRQVLGTDS